MIPDGLAIALLVASNIATLALLMLALRANWRWRNALGELGERTRKEIRETRNWSSYDPE